MEHAYVAYLMKSAGLADAFIPEWRWREIYPWSIATPDCVACVGLLECNTYKSPQFACALAESPFPPTEWRRTTRNDRRGGSVSALHFSGDSSTRKGV